MTIPTEAATLLRDLRNLIDFAAQENVHHPDYDLAAAFEAALTKAEAVPVAWRLRIGDSDLWAYCSREMDADFYGGASGLKYFKEPLYAHAPPAVPVESLGMDAAFEEWFADIWAGRDGIPVPPYQGDGWNEYIEKRQLALGAWMAALESAPPPASVPDGWMPISSAPKGRKVIAGYHNRLGNWRTIIACYYPAGTLEKEDNFGDIDDDGYASEGWYEEAESQEVIRQTEEMPTHWQPLPTPPTNQEGAAP